MDFRIQTHQIFGRSSPNMAFSIIGPKDFLLSVYSVIEHNAHQAVNQNTEGSKIVSLRLLKYRLWFFQVFMYIFVKYIHGNSLRKCMTTLLHILQNHPLFSRRKSTPTKKIGLVFSWVNDAKN